MKRRDLLRAMGALLASRALRSHADASANAATLYQRAMVFDANASPRLDDKLPEPQALLDLVRGSGVTAVKTSIGGFNSSFADTVAEIALYEAVIEAHPDVFLKVHRYADFARAKHDGKLGIVFSFETVTPLESKVERIELFRRLGVRVMQLGYNVASPFGMGCLGDAHVGLTELGRKAVDVMNAQRVAIDISHANEKTSMDVLAATKRSAIITHAGCAAVHAHPRNKPDALLRAVAQQGGVVGIYDLPYLTASPKQPTVDDYLTHMTHALDVCGEDHVGIGTDGELAVWDTSPAALAEFEKNEVARHQAGVAAPEEDRPLYVVGLNTPRRAEVIADALLHRGYKSRTVEKVLGLNFIEALRRIWES